MIKKKSRGKCDKPVALRSLEKRPKLRAHNSQRLLDINAKFVDAQAVATRPNFKAGEDDC